VGEREMRGKEYEYFCSKPLSTKTLNPLGHIWS
jgi:hypothetical protein